MDKEHQSVAVDILKKGGVILYPTDTILGLGCNAYDEAAIDKIYRIKHRPNLKSLIILVEDVRRLQSIVEVPELAWDIMDLSEKPVTIIYDNPKGLPSKLVAEDNTIAIRLTKDLFCKKLITKLNAPLVSTSANLSGFPFPQIFKEVSKEILEEVDYVFPECENFIPKHLASSIIKLSIDGKVKVIRE